MATSQGNYACSRFRTPLAQTRIGGGKTCADLFHVEHSIERRGSCRGGLWIRGRMRLFSGYKYFDFRSLRRLRRFAGADEEVAAERVRDSDGLVPIPVDADFLDLLEVAAANP